MRRGIAYLIVAVVVVAASFWFFYGQHAGPQFEGSVESVTLGVETSLITAPIWVAETEGYFDMYGLDVTIEEYDSGRASLVGMLNGEVDISAAAPTPIMFNSFVREDFQFFGTFASSNKNIKLTARGDRGITEPADLVGKTIGTSLGTTGQYVVEQLLLLEGIDSGAVTIADYGPSALPDALVNGEIDAMVIWEPHGNTARKGLEDNVVTLDLSHVYTTTFNFLATDELVQERPHVLERYLQAIDDAQTFIARKDVRAQEIVAERLGEDVADVALFWDNFAFGLSMDQGWLTNIENEAWWALDSNLVQGDVPNYLNMVYTDALEVLRPRAVTIVK